MTKSQLMQIEHHLYPGVLGYGFFKTSLPNLIL